MILDVAPRLARAVVVLASQSPRRKELLEQAGLKFLQMPSSFVEDLDKSVGPEKYCVATSAGKAECVLQELQKSGVFGAGEGSKPYVVIASDT